MGSVEIEAREGTPIWVVRAGRQGIYAEDFVSGGWVGIGWHLAGPLAEDASDEDIEEAVRRAYPSGKEGSQRVWAGQIKRFFREVKPGDPVATYDPSQRIYVLGKIQSGLEPRPEHDLFRARRVAWTHKIARDRLSVSARNSLGAILTLFRLTEEVSAELQRLAVSLDQEISEVPSQGPEVDEAGETSETILRDEVLEKAEAFIEDRIARLNWEQLQELVAGVLRAMGYRTRVAEAGPDRGVDVFASPDGLGLQEPRIFVEVKHRVGTTMGANEIRSFLGGRQPGDRCLYVSTGGFTREARYEAERSSVPLTLVTLPELRELVVEHYESMDNEARSLVPLRRFYWPID